MARAKNSQKAPGSGRRKGSIDLAERKLLSDRMAADLMTVYERMGGVEYLLKIATEDPKTFLAQGLSRLFPAPLRDDPEILLQQLNQYNQINGISDFEAARRVAFCLAKAMASQEISPQEACSLQPLERAEPRWIDPATLPRESEPIGDAELKKLAAQAEIDHFNANRVHGSLREQGLAKDVPTVEPRPRIPVRLRGKGRELI